MQRRKCSKTTDYVFSLCSCSSSAAAGMPAPPARIGCTAVACYRVELYTRQGFVWQSIYSRHDHGRHRPPLPLFATSRPHWPSHPPSLLAQSRPAMVNVPILLPYKIHSSRGRGPTDSRGRSLRGRLRVLLREPRGPRRLRLERIPVLRELLEGVRVRPSPIFPWQD